MPLDSTMPCLCCDCTVLVDSDKWRRIEGPIALCPRCASTIPPSMMRVLYIMRSQISTLQNDSVLAKRDIARLYKAQQEYEQATL
jgi:hypothetical protein